MTTVAKLFVSVLFLAVVASVALSVQAGRFDWPVAAAGSLYLTGLLVVGVFRDATDTRWWRAAFFGGVAAYGLAEYAASRDLFYLLFVVAGVAMLAAVARERR